MNFMTNMKTFTAVEYLAIDIANQFGDDAEVGFKGDKDTFENRIQWVRNNLAKLEERQQEADEPLLYAKAVMSFRKALKGLPIGHAVALDAVCSGMQVMSALIGCVHGATITGLINPDVRYDAYTEVTRSMNKALQEANLSTVVVSRKDAKEAVMTALYGSKAVPERIFEDVLPFFYRALENSCAGAYELLDILRDTWNPKALEHTWTLPDGHQAFVPVMVEFEDRLQISELKYTMSVLYTDNDTEEKGVANIANVVHSVDAYVLRSVVRKCSYNAVQVKRVLNAINNGTATQTADPHIAKANERYLATGIADIAIIDKLNNGNVHMLNSDYLEALSNTLSKMVQYQPFDVITIHDSYATHPNYCNILRYWYREALAEIADSTLMSDILNQLHGEDVGFFKDGEIGDMIRKSNYSLS